MSLTALGSVEIAKRLYCSDRVHVAVAHPDQVTDADVRHYHEQGFLAVDNLFTPAELEDAKAGLSHLIGGGNPAFTGVEFEAGVDVSSLDGRQREPYVRKLMKFCDFDQRLGAMANHVLLHRIMQRLLGRELNMVQDMALLKPPHIGREKPWHQDTAYFLYEPLGGVIGTWTALDEATPENGCMHVIPGSHLKGPKAHYHDRDCQLPDEEIDIDNDWVVPLKPGGTLLFSGLLHHGTPANQSAVGRRAVQLHYVAVDCYKIDGTRHAELFQDQAGYAGCASYQTKGLKTRPVSERVF